MRIDNFFPKYIPHIAIGVISLLAFWIVIFWATVLI